MKFKVYVCVVLCLLISIFAGCTNSLDEGCKNGELINKSKERALQGFVKITPRKVKKVKKDDSKWVYDVAFEIFEFDHYGRAKLIYDSTIVVRYNYWNIVDTDNKLENKQKLKSLNIYDFCVLELRFGRGYLIKGNRSESKNNILSVWACAFSKKTSLINPKITAVFFNEQIKLNKTVEIFHYIPYGWDNSILLDVTGNNNNDSIGNNM